MLHIQVYDLKSGLKLFKKRLLQSGVPFKVLISRQVIQGRGLLGGGGRDEHWTNWESCRELGGICRSLHCTNGHKLQTASFTSENNVKDLLSQPSVG